LAAADKRIGLIPKLDFDISYAYDSTPLGIVVPVQLVQLNRAIEISARFDTGCANCIFDRLFAEDLGLHVESVIQQKYRTVVGSFLTYRHEMTIRTLGLEWSGVIYFYSAQDQHGNFIGRQGWLDRVRVALVHYDRRLYLSAYDE
jgi:hypothetical protein